MRKHHGWTVRFAALAGALAILAGAQPAAAQTQIKPYMLLIFDNSGSMAGTPLTQAKTAVTNMVSAAGDVIFGLERFQTTCTGCTTGSCTWRACSSGISCPTPSGVYRANEGQILAGFGEENQAQVLRWVNTTCAGGDTGADPELLAVTWTPLHGSLDTALLYYRDGGTWLSTAYTSAISTDPYRGCRPYYVIMLTDGDETCGGCPQNGATALRSTRLTTLPCTTVADCCPAGTCRTSGAGTPSCTGSPGRCQYDVMTWDIGFRTAVPYATMENIAIAGGTDCPGTNRACYASDQTSLSAALSDIVASSVLVEICDGADNDCDGLIDEGFVKYCNRPSVPTQTLCADPGETLCDGIDNNCDGRTDEGLLNACGTCGATPAEICDLLDNDCDGSVDEGGVCGGCVVGAEVCDNLDNDCDGLTDELLTRPCGTSIGQCRPGTQTCSAGAWGACVGSTPPTAELCNNLDDDCDGRTDGFSRPCGTDVGVCEFGAEMCVAGTGWTGVCVGSYGGSAEVCNLLDDDCDGSTDEGDPGGGGECGGSVGECLPGIRHCIGGTLVCGGGSEPTPELCDNRDNDCDGFTDEGNPGGGGTCYSGPAGTEGVGVCEGGVERCLGGAIVCDGEVLPRPEDCNNLDDDCDTLTDEDLVSGGTCGSDEGECTAGTQDCVSGAWVCSGEVGPTTEICDLLDNDCDGGTDEGNPGGGAACGWTADPASWDLGICEPGLSDCVAGSLDCVGMVGPETEVCNGLDDDCNGLTDDGLGLGDPCGTEEGECEPGTMACVDGRTECVGGVGPSTEVCDCGDDDCDGQTDEDDPCGGGATCVESAGTCTCAELCDPLIEFPCPVGFECVAGLNPEDPSAAYCVLETEECGTTTCGACQTCNRATETCEDTVCPRCQVCQPETDRCVDATCVPDCTEPDVCVCGECIPPDCYTPGFECDAGENCEPDATTGRGRCVPNDCYEVSCAPPQFCRDDEGCSPSTPEGCCHDPCELIDTCPTGQVCYDGECIDDPHLCTPACPSGQVCVDGACVADTCGAVECAWPLECDPDTGDCEEPPCWDLTCPTGYECRDGTCFENSHPADDQDGGGDGTTGDAAGSQVIATGAGGCACTTSGGSSPAGALGLLGLVGLGLLLRVRRRESRTTSTPAGRG
ncbi:MAG: MYXO-CTERM sorting domain-containing protein [Deltaproteobacteria bacterium]|nr:MYXO-CTERM sorting domain-containing protein [Deltaproteobacteria bacterium]